MITIIRSIEFPFGPKWSYDLLLFDGVIHVTLNGVRFLARDSATSQSVCECANCNLFALSDRFTMYRYTESIYGGGGDVVELRVVTYYARDDNTGNYT